MNSLYTIVVPDAETLSCLCGTNDNNLELIETYLGTPVFVRGNELSIDDERPDIQDKFKYIIDRISDEISAGEFPGKDMILSVMNAAGCEETSVPPLKLCIPGGNKSVYPKTFGQKKAVEAMMRHELVFLEGPAGSGKTFLAVAAALCLLLKHKAKRLILTRPIVEAGENLGFLPGDFEQKIYPYLLPLFNIMENLLPPGLLRKLTESRIIETVPLAYMRGRTLSDCVVVLDEAQNTTREQMKMFLTRMGDNVKMFITGDISQTDLPGRIPSGLIHALGILRKIEEIQIIRMENSDVVRNQLVKKIIQAYEDSKSNE